MLSEKKNNLELDLFRIYWKQRIHFFSVSKYNSMKGSIFRGYLLRFSYTNTIVVSNEYMLYLFTILNRFVQQKINKRNFT